MLGGSASFYDSRLSTATSDCLGVGLTLLTIRRSIWTEELNSMYVALHLHTSKSNAALRNVSKDIRTQTKERHPRSDPCID